MGACIKSLMRELKDAGNFNHDHDEVNGAFKFSKRDKSANYKRKSGWAPLD